MLHLIILGVEVAAACDRAAVLSVCLSVCLLQTGEVDAVELRLSVCLSVCLLQTGEVDAVELRRREEARRLAAARRRNEEMGYHSKLSDTADGRPQR